MKNFSNFLKGFLCLFLLVGGGQTNAQSTQDYNFSQYVDTYVPITGGATTTTGVVDNNIAKVAIPGGFSYLGRVHDSVTISNNGHISFPSIANSNSVGTTTYSIISASLTNTGGAIAAFAADLQGLAAGEVRYETVGNEFVVQWSNYRRYAVSGDTLNFQVRLNQSNGEIKIVYGRMTNGTSTNYQPQVGLRGVAATDFNSRFVEASTGPWVNSVRATTNTATCIYNGATASAAAKPANGTTFLYAPSSCLSAPISSVTNITLNSATVNWTANPNVVGYEYYYSTSSTAPTTTTTGTMVTTNTANLTGLSSSTTYYVWLRIHCSATEVSQWSPAYTFATACGIINTLPWTENFDGISANGTFTSGRMSNCWSSLDEVCVMSTASTYISARSGSNVLGYRYGANETTGAWAITPGFQLQAGVSYRYKFYYKNYSTSAFQSLTVKIGTAQTYTALTTTLGAPLTNITNTTYQEYYVDFTVPTDGVYYIGMNVFVNTSPWYLSVDDVSLDYSPSCIPPMTINLSNLSPYSIDVQLTGTGTPLSYEYYYSTNATAPTAGTTGTIITNTSFTINGLQSATNYYLWARTNCSATETSAWTAVYTFATPCVSITSLPWTENFDGISANGTFTSGRMPSCWTSLDEVCVMSTASTYINARSGSNALGYRYGASTTTGAWAITPGFQLQAGVSYRYKFYYKNYNTSAYQSLTVKIGTAQNYTALTTTLGTPLTNIVNTTYQEYYVDFMVPADGVYYIGMNVYVNSSPWYLSVDDVSLDYSPSCTPPLTVNLSNLGSNSVDVALTSAGTPLSYEYYYSTSSTAPTAATTGTTTTNPSFTISGLQPASNYYLWIRTQCSATDISAWTAVYPFTTTCVAITTLPWVENFDGITANGTHTPGRIVNCWKAIDEVGVMSNASTYVTPRSGTNAIAYRYGANTATGAWTITPGFQLQAGVSYRYKFYYKNYSVSPFDSLFVKIGTSQLSNALTTTLGTPLRNIINTTYQEYYVDFMVPTDGVYYIGMNVFVTTAPWYLSIDDVSLDYSPSCIAPSTVSISNVEAHSADISWTNLGTVPNSEYYLSTTTTVPSVTTTGTVVTGLSVHLDNLQENTTYYLWVRNNCSATDNSTWTAMHTFTTPCEAITTLPWIENFDAVPNTSGTFTAGRMPSCWKSLDAAGIMTTASDYIRTTSGSAALAFRYGASTTTGAWAITPGFQLQAGVSYRFRFSYANYNTSAFQSLTVKIGNTQDYNSLTTTLGTPLTNIVNTTFKDFIVDFTVPADGIYYIGLNVFVNSSPWYLSVDDMSLKLSPACPDLTNVTASNMTLNSATVSWTAPTQATVDGYEYYISTTNTEPSLATAGIAVSGTSVNLTNLQDRTLYYVWVRTTCNGTDKGEWKPAPLIYTGPCIPTARGGYYLNSVVTTGAENNISYTGTEYLGFAVPQQTLLARQEQVVTYTISATPEDHHYFVWVDWNNDLDFADAGEAILSYTASYEFYYTGSFQIPANAPVGRYTMRVANAYDGTIPSCGSNVIGSYVDFVLEVKYKCPPTTMSISSTNACGNSLGSVALDVVSTSPDVTYVWSTGVSNTPVLTDLSMGNYTVTVVTDPTYPVCTFVDSVAVRSSIIATALRQLAPDCGAGNGSADVVAVGNNLSYLWSTGDVTPVIENLQAGVYTLTVTDGICEKYSTVEVYHQAGFSVSADITNEDINNPNSGAINIVDAPAGATYVWSTGETTASINGLVAGTYTVTVTSADGCTSVETFVVDTRTSVIDAILGEIKLYPNPTFDIVHLAGVPVDAKVVLVNNLGQVVKEFIAQNEVEAMDLSNLAASTYWIRIEHQEASVVLPVVKLK